MTAFGRRGKRYLWTDAFAVCNYLGLGRIDEALALVDRVHGELGCSPGEPSDDELEWDRDGQYFHYLTKWMHALAPVAAIAGISCGLASSPDTSPRSSSTSRASPPRTGR